MLKWVLLLYMYAGISPEKYVRFNNSLSWNSNSLSEPTEEINLNLERLE